MLGKTSDYCRRPIVQSRRQAHADMPAAKRVSKMNIGSFETLGPSRIARAMCATTMRPKIVPLVMRNAFIGFDPQCEELSRDAQSHQLKSSVTYLN